MKLLGYARDTEFLGTSYCVFLTDTSKIFKIREAINFDTGIRKFEDFQRQENTPELYCWCDTDKICVVQTHKHNLEVWLYALSNQDSQNPKCLQTFTDYFRDYKHLQEFLDELGYITT